jgi:hypothetical protein
MVRSADGKHILIQSYADPVHPTTVHVLTLPGAATNLKFISRTEIGYSTNSLPDNPAAGITTMWRMRLDDLQPISVARVLGDVIATSWSPDGANVAFIAAPPSTSDAGLHRLWLKVGSAGPRALTPLIPFYGREYTNTDQLQVSFSHDGRYLLMVDSAVAGRAPVLAASASFQVRSVPDGTIVWVPPSALKVVANRGTMAAWSHLSDFLYFSEAGVHTWDARTGLVGNVAGADFWFNPSVAPDDRLVAYAASGADGKPHLEMRNLESGSVRKLSGVRGLPILLSVNLMLEGHYLPNVNGAPGPAYYLGRYYALNLLTNVETMLPGPPLDVWTAE